MSHPLSIRLDDELDSRLGRLARLTGRTKSFYLRQAVIDQIDDLEDVYLARKVSRRVAEGKEPTVTLEDLEQQIGMAD